jgi:hypothetical protein
MISNPMTGIGSHTIVSGHSVLLLQAGLEQLVGEYLNQTMYSLNAISIENRQNLLIIWVGGYQKSKNTDDHNPKNKLFPPP